VAEFEANKREIDQKAATNIAGMFGHSLAAPMQKFVRVCMASSLYHREELTRLYPATALIRTTSLYTESQVQGLSQYVKVAKMGEDRFCERVTCIPPHVSHTCLLEEVKTKIHSLVPEFCSMIERQLDYHTFNGTLREARMRSLIEAGNEGVQDQLRVLI
jgi:hypothetical protein